MRLPQGAEENYSFTISFEHLLRSKALVTAIYRGYDPLLLDEADLFSSFSSKINDSWSILDGYIALNHSMAAR